MANAKIPTDHISIYVRDAGTDEVLIDLSADEPRSPASTIKVLTTFAALDMLGPAYTWKTRAYADGRLANGVLHGDLIIKGGGDPYMTAERWWMFIQNLRERGLVKITGDIVVDNSYFEPIGTNRADFDTQPFRTYNVLPDALMVNFQTSRFTISAMPQRAQPQVTINPLPANLIVKNQLRLGSGVCQGYNRGISFGMPDENDPTLLVISGVFPAACGRFSINRAIMAAPEYAYGTFRTFWVQSGGVIDGAFRMGVLPEGARLLYEHESLPLPEVVRLVNKFSNNIMARHLLLTLAAEQTGTPASIESGRTAIRNWLARQRIEIPGFVLENGSGLSRIERLTARGLGEMLDIAWHNPFMPEFAASLPLSAMDGTLRNRFKSPGMQGRIRLKTGRLDHVSALAGFVNAASGKTYVVVIFVNHPDAHLGSGEAIQAELIRWVFGQ
ncbi:D-alanyl-D-alanine carboxypeptidase/D-alanyl-D-alanine endopeptidase [Steroidobacter denitrificans]|nr:D-alanyl-D-alanine carboxypeptidase/D-alanyl-D-alanine-endopeptidase [Steroidobacter denitrificans]